MAGYGAYLLATTKKFDLLGGSTLILGSLVGLLAVFVTCGGYAKPFVLRLFILFLLLASLTELVIASLFLAPGTQQSVIDTLSPPANLRQFIESNLTSCGAVWMSFVLLQVVAVIVLFCQIRIVRRELLEEEESELVSDRYSAIRHEEQKKSASKKYREKNIEVYSKYNINRPMASAATAIP